MNSYSKIEEVRKRKGYCLLSLIDPDLKNDPNLSHIIKNANSSMFDGILIGGSSIEDGRFEDRVRRIKDESNLPIMLFPGSSKQLTNLIDSVLYLNLISGRNPKYLIEEHVNGAMKIKEYELFTVPTAYILLDGGTETSVQKVSNTRPLDMHDKDLVLSHALAGQYLGNKIIYFDCGSGSDNTMNVELLKYISDNIDTPIMVGGGIKSKDNIETLVNAGASYIVIGNIIEDVIASDLFK